MSEAGQPADPLFEPPDPRQASIACLNELEADPVGRACGVAPLLPPAPPPPAPCVAVTPCSSRHFWRLDDSDVPELDLPELDAPELDLPELEPVPAELPPPQPATPITAASATAPKMVGRMARRPCLLPGRSKRLIKRFPP